jgi:hypothetical protein
MTDDPAALRDQAREWGRSLLEAAPWESVSDRVTLLVVTPPASLEALVVPGHVALWLTIDRPAVRSLSADLARPLTQDEAVVQHHRAAGDTPAVTLTAMTDEALHRLLQGMSRRAMEARWHVRHVEAVADRLRRAEQYQARAGMLPEDGVERLARTLWVETAVAARGLDGLRSARPAEAIPAAGEAAAALCRLACAWDDGAYPLTEYLRAAAAETRIGRRVAPWLDDFGPAIGGDEAATRRVLGSREQALAEVRAVLGERFRARPWLTDPEAYALRAPR